MRTILMLLSLATAGFSASDYKLVWSDEFDRPGLPDAANWSYDVGGWGWGNGELQFYKAANPKNSWVDSGVLKITVHREDTTYADWRGNEVTNPLSSARLYTAFKHDWLYGRFEARMKLPKGAGLWPAFWLVPPAGGPYGQWPACGEIDILEHYGAEPGVIHGSVHTKNNFGGTSRSGYAVLKNPNDSFHVYAMDWRPDTITISVDGIDYFSYANPKTTFEDWPFDQSFPIILNVAINGNWEAGTVDTTVLPQSLVVDYVRVYQLSEASNDVSRDRSLVGFKASLSAGNILMSTSQAGAWFLRRPDGSLVGHGTLMAGETHRSHVEAKGLLILQFQPADGPASAVLLMQSRASSE